MVTHLQGFLKPDQLESEPEPEDGLVDDFESELLQNGIVENAPDYKVAASGVYRLLDFVPCKQQWNSTPVCAFLAATVIGLDPTKVKQK